MSKVYLNHREVVRIKSKQVPWPRNYVLAGPQSLGSPTSVYQLSVDVRFLLNNKGRKGHESKKCHVGLHDRYYGGCSGLWMAIYQRLN